MIFCPMCGDACLSLCCMEEAAPLGFFCANLDCIAQGVVYVPEGFDAAAFVAEWGDR